jgi:hypothetical protein
MVIIHAIATMLHSGNYVSSYKGENGTRSQTYSSRNSSTVCTTKQAIFFFIMKKPVLYQIGCCRSSQGSRGRFPAAAACREEGVVRASRKI